MSTIVEQAKAYYAAQEAQKQSQEGQQATPGVQQEPAQPQEQTPVVTDNPTTQAEITPEIPEGYVRSEDAEVYKTELETLKKDFGLIESDPILKELLGLKRKNVAITHELLQEGYRDYSQIDTNNLEQAKNILRQELVAKGYSEKEAFLAVKRQYRELHDEAADRESEDYQAEEFALKRAANDLIEQKKANQVRLKEIQSTPTNKDEILKQIREEQEQYTAETQKQLKDVAETILDKHKKVTHSFSFGNGEKDQKMDIAVDVEITKEMKAQLKKDLQNANLVQAIYDTMNQKQSPEALREELARKVMLFRYPELVMGLVVDQANSKRLKDFVGSEIKHTRQGVPGESPEAIDYSQHPRLGALAKAMAAEKSRA